MRRANLLLVLMLLFSAVNAQKAYFVKASGGRVFFGTGDVSGFGVGVEVSTPVSYKKAVTGSIFMPVLK